ncbi:hypothetical protein [Burkholderia cenocepacia]|uniref:hypothetical protein n=1 Tax=Burkholderia cenocepacia TaxID=95486 RepID=UPI00076DEFB1|nr:hypothetical protein [Burkholderia cenocepacia]KWU26417.1 hypothetical protein AS149_25860 [Burkholderia cenocepacia]
MHAKAGELNAFGRLNRKTGRKELFFVGGEGVPVEAVELLRETLSQKRYTILCMLDNRLPEPAMSAELDARGYDLASLRFSISLKSAGVTLPKRLQQIRIRKNALSARWGRDSDGTPDLCFAWGLPCTRRDASLLYSIFANATYTQRELLSRQHHDNTFQKKLVSLGFDMRTLRFVVKKPTPVTAVVEPPLEATSVE